MMRAVMLVWLLGCGKVQGETRDAAADTGASVDMGVDAGEVTAGLIARYRMDDLASGGTVPDDMHHDGSCVAPACPGITADGRIGKAYDFDGKDDLVRIPVANAPELNTETALTVTVWIYRRSTSNAGCFINKAYRDGDSNSWQACVNDDTRLTFYSAGVSEDAQPSRMLDVEVWYHVALRWDGSAKETYIDGTQVIQNIGVSIQFDANDISIGGDLDGHVPTAWFNGRIDDVRIYDRALTKDELRELANPPSP